MSDTIREQIIMAYLDRLKSMIVGNGYNYDYGNETRRATPIIDDSLTEACVLWPQPESVGDTYNDRNVITMPVRVEVMVAFNPVAENPSVIQEKILGDMIHCMTRTDVPRPDLVADINYTGGGPAEIPDAQHTRVAAYAEFNIEYDTLIGDPYQQ